MLAIHLPRSSILAFYAIEIVAVNARLRAPNSNRGADRPFPGGILPFAAGQRRLTPSAAWSSTFHRHSRGGGDETAMTESVPQNASVTAALLVIGDEILSGRTKDKNIGYIAEYLTGIGIDLKEVRVVADEEADIVDAVNALRHRYSYLFTTGGIGPTHDDITADCVAKAFGVTIDVDPRARTLLLQRIPEKDLNEARLRMARIPAGADLIVNKVSNAPGFHIGNVFVMAGVPAIMQAMLDEVAPTLKTGAKMLSESIRADLREGDIGSELGAVAKAHPGVTIGSYPFFDDTRGPNTNVVVRARDPRALAAAKAEVEAMLARVRAAFAAPL
ncbi:MAG TPA: competence/damage-inducible protein A [Rhodanobacteraceae bacterium]|nr:competence/damage-inducible protein A [Rhodanobacteraceae bacterium]